MKFYKGQTVRVINDDRPLVKGLTGVVTGKCELDERIHDDDFIMVSWDKHNPIFQKLFSRGSQPADGGWLRERFGPARRCETW